MAHSYSRDADWAPQFLEAYDRLAAKADAALPPPPASLADLPLVEVRAATAGPTFAVLLSGDGGWAGLDKKVAAALAEKGIDVVGVDSLALFLDAAHAARSRRRCRSRGALLRRALAQDRRGVGRLFAGRGRAAVRDQPAAARLTSARYLRRDDGPGNRKRRSNSTSATGLAARATPFRSSPKRRSCSRTRRCASMARTRRTRCVPSWRLTASRRT